jgi:hypothetical protein
VRRRVFGGEVAVVVAGLASGLSVGLASAGLESAPVLASGDEAVLVGSEGGAPEVTVTETDGETVLVAESPALEVLLSVDLSLDLSVGLLAAPESLEPERLFTAEAALR